MRPRSARRQAAPQRWLHASRPLVAALLLAAAALVGAGCTPVPRPVIEIWGDSLTCESEALARFQLGDAYDVRIESACGIALCDWTDEIAASADARRPAVVLVQFSGNTFTPCTRPDGVAPTTAQALARYRADATWLLERTRAVGVPLVFVGTPPSPAAPPFDETVDSVYASIAASSGGWATYLDAGAAVAGTDGRWTATLPCLSFEGPEQGCVDGSVRVRSSDGVHFCPGTMAYPPDEAPTCSTWASGAWRYAAMMTGYARVAVGADPIGSLDGAVGAPGQVRMTGWAYDPQAGEAPIEVRVSVDAAGSTVTTAGGLRSDVAVVHPYAGPWHGYDVLVPVAAGRHTVCAYGVDVGRGEDALLGCRSVVVWRPPTTVTLPPLAVSR